MLNLALFRNKNVKNRRFRRVYVKLALFLISSVLGHVFSARKITWTNARRLLECTATLALIHNNDATKEDGTWAQRYWVRRSARSATGLEAETKNECWNGKGSFGSLVFNDAEQQKRLPKNVYEALRRTVTQGRGARSVRSPTRSPPR